MRAMALEPGERRLASVEVPKPTPGYGEVLIDIAACGVCRTDLHILDNDIDQPDRPLVLGHEIVGRVAALGPGVSGFSIGARVGVPWLGGACGRCPYCLADMENLCDKPDFTGLTRDGGFAEACVADAAFAIPLSEGMKDEEIALLLCAGLIGFRALRFSGEGRSIGIYGFGAAGHLVAQIARWRGQEVYAFTRPGDEAAQELARRLGVVWAGGSDETPPAPRDAAIIFAPVGALATAALRAVRKGGIVVCAGIHMSDIPSFPYEILWGERSIRSIANLTRKDAEVFFPIARRAGVRPVVERFALEDANEALDRLRDGAFSGAAVLLP